MDQTAALGFTLPSDTINFNAIITDGFATLNFTLPSDTIALAGTKIHSAVISEVLPSDTIAMAATKIHTATIAATLSSDTIDITATTTFHGTSGVVKDDIILDNHRGGGIVDYFKEFFIYGQSDSTCKVWIHPYNSKGQVMGDDYVLLATVTFTTDSGVYSNLNVAPGRIKFTDVEGDLVYIYHRRT